MSRKNREIDYAAALENDYARWYELFTKGGFDPSWADGSNLNLLRSHIIKLSGSEQAPKCICKDRIIGTWQPTIRRNAVWTKNNKPI